MSDNSYINRRKFRRMAVEIPAVVHVKQLGKMFPATVLDISEGGAFVHCTAPIMVGDEVFVELSLQETKILDAKVIDWEEWVRKNIPDNEAEKSVVKWARGTSTSGFGIEFVELKQDKRKFLTKLLDSFEKISQKPISPSTD